MKEIYRRLFSWLIVAGMVTVVACLPLAPAQADELDDVQGELQKLQQELDSSKKASKPLEEDLDKLRARLSAIRVTIGKIETDIVRRQKQLDIAEKTLAKQKTIVDQRIFEHYKNIKKAESSMISVLVSPNLTESLQAFFYQKKATDNDKQAIVQTILYIDNIDKTKQKLVSEKGRLSEAKKQVDAQSESIAGEVGKAKNYQQSLSNKIASLSARQQQLLAQKLGSLNLPTSLGFGALSCTDDRKLDPGFGSGFAFFTYGIPHRIGMNQYGALGRANDNQNVEQILQAYFANVELKKDYDQGITIQVEGHGAYSIEDYVKRIYEMPASWPLEALKAQAVAARTYALNYTNNGQKSICTTQSCQVFKPEEKGGRWNEAVEATKGWVLIHGGSPITAWYASTAGGYTFESSDVGWSARPWTKRLQDGRGPYNSFSDLNNNAYDKDSPCFYAAQGYRKEYGNSAWLRPGEVADIVNVLMLAKADGSTQTHLSQPDKPNPDGTDTWDSERVKQELRNRGQTPFSSISSISVGADFGIGRTTSINFSGDGGSKSFEGSEWKAYFNLRAPANIQIVGGLFNIETR